MNFNIFTFHVFFFVYISSFAVIGETNPCKDSVYQALDSKPAESLSKKETRILQKKMEKCNEYYIKSREDRGSETKKKARPPRQTIKRRFKEIKESKLSTIFVDHSIRIGSETLGSRGGDLGCYSFKPEIYDILYLGIFGIEGYIGILNISIPAIPTAEELKKRKPVFLNNKRLDPGCAYYADVKTLKKKSSETIGSMVYETWSVEPIFKKLDDSGIKRCLFRTNGKRNLSIILLVSTTILTASVLTYFIASGKIH